jgi:hypothetical protein
MTTDFRALCAELVDIVTAHCNPDDSAVGYCAAVLTRARAALGLAESEDLFARIDTLLDGIDRDECHPDGGWWQTSDGSKFGRIKLRELKELIASSLSPSHPATQPEPAPTDEEIEEWADACFEAPLEELDPEIHGWRRCFTAQEFSKTIRAALTRYGTPNPITKELK